MRMARELKRGLIIAGIATIPLWYSYRSFGEKRPLKADEIFDSETTRLRKELQALKDQASDAARLRASADTIRQCLATAVEARRIQARFSTTYAEFEKYLTAVDSSSAGAAIAANPDYVRAYREFTDPRVFWDPLNSLERIQKSEADCRNAKPTDQLRDADWGLNDLQKAIEHYTSWLEKLEWAKRNVSALEGLASGKPVPNLSEAVARQAVLEAAQNYRAKRRESLFKLETNAPYDWQR